MEQESRSRRALLLLLLPPLTTTATCAFFVSIILFSSQGASAYHNYTVGDSLGWYDKLQHPQVNYQKWVAGKNFSLGDFLIFDTDKSHSVIQTYNATTYRRCDYNDAETDDTISWSSGEPQLSKAKVTVAVPLLKEGMTYFFSGNFDGRQCRHGQHFKINVTRGEGLPESLWNLHEPAPAPDRPEPGGSGVAVAVPSVPSSFDNSMQAGSVEAASGAGEGLLLTLWRKEGRGGFQFVLSLLGILFVLSG